MASTQTEVQFNSSVLAHALDVRMPGWKLEAERTGVLNRAGLQPDIVAERSGNSIIVETEFMPASTVDDDATARFTQVKQATNLKAVIAVRLPREWRNLSEQESKQQIDAGVDMEYCVYTSSEERYPTEGWLVGSCDDLVRTLELSEVSHVEIAQAAEIMQDSVQKIADVLISHPQDIANKGVNIETLEALAVELHQEAGEQTTRMAICILVNAVVFHDSIAKKHGVDTFLEREINSGRKLDTEEIYRLWQEILEINYYPIFSIASKLILLLHITDYNQQVAALLLESSRNLRAAGLDRIQDLSGQVFGQLIADRKFLATYYTKPSSATLLAELAVARFPIDWSNAHAVKKLRLADFACGTGSLLTASYRAVSAKVRRAGGDDKSFHSHMMGNVILGADIMPAAVHLTASALSSHYPGEPYQDSSVLLFPYGKASEGQENNASLSLGSLELLDSESQPNLLFGDYKATATRVTSRGEETQGEKSVPHNDYDLVIMNPPYVRPTNHEIANVPVPSFAGLGNTDEVQKQLSNQLKILTSKSSIDIVGDGHAGLASHFLQLAHRKVKKNGVIAFVLPAIFLSGKSWNKARQLLTQKYKDIIIFSIAAHGSVERSFSDDTHMAECLLIATRKQPNESSVIEADNCLYVNLKNSPKSHVEAANIAQQVHKLLFLSNAGTKVKQIAQGGNVLGSCITASIEDSGCAQINNLDLAELCIDLTRRYRLRLPRLELVDLPLTALRALGTVGPVHRSIGMKAESVTAQSESGWTRQPSGPFIIEALLEGTRPSYPCLWSHDAKRETRMLLSPDSEGKIYNNQREAANEMWNRAASNLHFTLDYRLNSQPLTACITAERCLGGTAWPGFLLDGTVNDLNAFDNGASSSGEHLRAMEKALALWANSTLGAIAFWWIGSRQQQGRARLTVTRLPNLTVLDVTQLTVPQLDEGETIFDEFAAYDLKPINEAWNDNVRQELDSKVLTGLLKLNTNILKPLSDVREQWCSEPTVHGGKQTAPPAYFSQSLE